MNYLILVSILLLGSFSTHLLWRSLVGKISPAIFLWLANGGIFLVTFFAYFILVSVVESQIYGSSGMYDVELLLFLFWGLLSSFVSSFLVRRAREG